MIPTLLRRVHRAAILLPLIFAACTSAPPVRTDFPPLSYDYLTHLVLAVGAIDIDQSYVPPYGPGEVGQLSPVPPQAALVQMAQDRLFAGGGAGRATFRILNASITQSGAALQASFAVRVEVTNGSGTGSGFAEARVVRTAPFDPDSNIATLRAALYDLTKATMDDMNVEFEYQIRRTLGGYLQGAGGAGPTAAPVEQQALPPPGASVAPAQPPAPGVPPPASAPPASAPPASAQSGTSGPLQLAPPPPPAAPPASAPMPVPQPAGPLPLLPPPSVYTPPPSFQPMPSGSPAPLQLAPPPPSSPPPQPAQPLPLLPPPAIVTPPPASRAPGPAPTNGPMRLVPSGPLQLAPPT